MHKGIVERLFIFIILLYIFFYFSFIKSAKKSKNLTFKIMLLTRLLLVLSHCANGKYFAWFHNIKYLIAKKMIVKLRMVTIYSNGASNILLVFKIHETFSYFTSKCTEGLNIYISNNKMIFINRKIVFFIYWKVNVSVTYPWIPVSPSPSGYAMTPIVTSSSWRICCRARSVGSWSRPTALIRTLSTWG